MLRLIVEGLWQLMQWNEILNISLGWGIYSTHFFMDNYDLMLFCFNVWMNYDVTKLTGFV